MDDMQSDDLNIPFLADFNHAVNNESGMFEERDIESQVKESEWKPSESKQSERQMPRGPPSGPPPRLNKHNPSYTRADI